MLMGVSCHLSYLEVTSCLNTNNRALPGFPYLNTNSYLSVNYTVASHSRNLPAESKVVICSCGGWLVHALQLDYLVCAFTLFNVFL